MGRPRFCSPPRPGQQIGITPVSARLPLVSPHGVGEGVGVAGGVAVGAGVGEAVGVGTGVGVAVGTGVGVAVGAGVGVAVGAGDGVAVGTGVGVGVGTGVGTAVGIGVGVGVAVGLGVGVAAGVGVAVAGGAGVGVGGGVAQSVTVTSIADTLPCASRNVIVVLPAPTPVTSNHSTDLPLTRGVLASRPRSGATVATRVFADSPLMMRPPASATTSTAPNVPRQMLNEGFGAGAPGLPTWHSIERPESAGASTPEEPRGGAAPPAPPPEQAVNATTHVIASHP